MAKNTKTYSEEQIQEVLDKIPDLENLFRRADPGSIGQNP